MQPATKYRHFARINPKHIKPDQFKIEDMLIKDEEWNGKQSDIKKEQYTRPESRSNDNIKIQEGDEEDVKRSHWLISPIDFEVNNTYNNFNDVSETNTDGFEQYILDPVHSTDKQQMKKAKHYEYDEQKNNKLKIEAPKPLQQTGEIKLEHNLLDNDESLKTLAIVNHDARISQPRSSSKVKKSSDSKKLLLAKNSSGKDMMTLRSR